MKCIKTGCVAKLTQYGEYVVGDAFLINDVLVIRNVSRTRENPRDYCDITCHDVEQWFEDEPTGTLFSRAYSIKDLNNVRKPS